MHHHRLRIARLSRLICIAYGPDRDIHRGWLCARTTIDMGTFANLRSRRTTGDLSIFEVTTVMSAKADVLSILKHLFGLAERWAVTQA